ncbi:PTS system trehalose-specific EIIBC component [Collinsella ihumii]|uniref:PTS system trehalose-specific EIIBC component n=1 Tax=Collinsella ihumii TaxID=1720204 RepID=A0AAW7JPI3_9ACTN|nr:PTS system trehalose-specific EIIBC component [Collinsella ihumii]MDN0068769.1 PTS system trehalose-specific EIIBC component [Collinsella ihumii]
MAKYTEDAAKLLDLVGGKENISAVTHCMTRMRFVLVDEGKADVAAIEELSAAKGTFTQAGQFQVIIGNDVADFYQEFTKVSGIEGVSKEAAKAAAGANQNPLQRAMGVLGEIFAPLIPALICGGLILGFRNIIGEVNFFNDAGAFDLEHGTKSIADMWVFWNGMYSFLWVIGEAVFHMLPVGICWSVTRKMGTTPILGIILGLTLVSPQLLNGFSVAGASAEDIAAHTYNFGFYSFVGTGYQGQVIASLMAAFVLVGLEKFFTKVTPDVVRMIVVPFMSLVPAVFIAHLVVGPIGWAIGDAIANAVSWGLASDVRVLFAALFGLLYAPLVMTGLHHMTNAIDSQMVSIYEYTTLWPMIALSNIAQGSAVLAMIVLQKRNERAQQVNIPACISCYLGVTEPALFGVNLKYKFPLVCGMIGSACAAMVCTGFGVKALSIGVGGLPGILSIMFNYWGIFALCMLIAIVVPFVLTLIVGKRQLSAADRGIAKIEAAAAESATDAEPASASAPAASAEPREQALLAPLAGRVMPITEMPDPMFASKVMGDGVCIEPSGDTVVAPADCTVTVTMPASNHAVGLTLDNGVELLIHVGIDTVDMGGDGFACFVNQGDKVKAGTKLLTFDTEKIAAAGHPATTAFIVASTAAATDFDFASGMDAAEGQTPVITYRG